MLCGSEFKTETLAQILHKISLLWVVEPKMQNDFPYHLINKWSIFHFSGNCIIAGDSKHQCTKISRINLTKAATATTNTITSKTCFACASKRSWRNVRACGIRMANWRCVLAFIYVCKKKSFEDYEPEIQRIKFQCRRFVPEDLVGSVHQKFKVPKLQYALCSLLQSSFAIVKKWSRTMVSSL